MAATLFNPPARHCRWECSSKPRFRLETKAHSYCPNAHQGVFFFFASANTIRRPARRPPVSDGAKMMYIISSSPYSSNGPDGQTLEVSTRPSYKQHASKHHGQRRTCRQWNKQCRAFLCFIHGSSTPYSRTRDLSNHISFKLAGLTPIHSICQAATVWVLIYSLSNEVPHMAARTDNSKVVVRVEHSIMET